MPDALGIPKARVPSRQDRPLARGLTVADANVVPRDFVRMFEGYLAGRKDNARMIHYEKIALMDHIAMPVHMEFIQCCKQALYWQGIVASLYARKPMMPLGENGKQELCAAPEIMGVPLVR